MLAFPAYAAAAGQGADKPLDAELDSVEVRGIGKQTATNYTVPTSSVATGIRLTQRETPQSLSVITEKQIDDQRLDTLQDVLKQVPGVYHSKMGNNATGDSQFAARGSAIDSVSVDGAAKFLYESNSIRRSTNNLDSALYEQVAVVRGSSGLTNGGFGEPSGMIALERKKPQAKPFTVLEAAAGSWQHYRFIADANSPLNADNTLRGRAIFVRDHGGDYLPRTSRHNHTLYGILSYNVQPQTQVQLGTEIHVNRNTGSSRFGYLTIAGNETDGFIPFEANPRNNSSANWAYGKETRAELFTRLRHEFDNGWQLDGGYAYLYGKNDNLSAIAGTYDINADYSSYVSVDLDKSRFNEHKFNLNLNGDYGLFGRRHEFNTGISYLNSKDYGPYYGDKDVPVADLRRFDGNIARPELPYLQDGYQQSRHLSVYGSTRFKLTDKWSLIGGMRLMNWKYAYRTERNRFADGRRSEKAFIPYLGTTYDITPNLTAYASYTTVFRPQVRYLTQNGNPLAPQRGRTYETGLKASWFEGRLNAAVSVYRNKRDKIGVLAGRLPNGERYYKAEDHTSNTGGELSINGRLNDRWLLNASYARSKTKNSKGKQIKTTYPVHLFKFFTGYDINDRLTVGGNVNWQSFIIDDREEVTEPAARKALAQRAYATLDLTAQYKIGKRTRVALDVENVFNKYYKTMPDIHVYGTPRSITASLRYTFD